MLSRSGEDSTIQVPYIERADRALLPFLKQSHFVRFIKTNSTDLVEHGSRWVAKWPSSIRHPKARGKETLTEFSRMAGFECKESRRLAAALKRSFDHQRQWTRHRIHYSDKFYAPDLYRFGN